MGIPASSRNIFPSNIQGLPTWFEVRISENGHLGRRGGVDMMVAMNPQTWNQDIAEIEPGGYLFYDSTKPMPASRFRDDINVIGAPLTEICNRTYNDARQRQLFKNIIYLGVLSALLDMDVAAIEKLIGEQFRGKDALIKPNLHALHLGRDWARDELDCPIGIRLERRDKVGDRIFVSGNDAAALGAVYGGATVCAWYPITPSSSLAEAFAAHCHRLRRDPETKKNRYAIIQAEDELASIGMVIGAAWNGARAFTATSGPGISLMQEFIGLAYFAEIPAVIFDIQRGSPSTGMPTRTQQADILSAAYASHGDTKHVLLFPRGPERVVHLCRRRARSRRPAANPGLRDDGSRHRHERLARAEPLAWDADRRYDRGKVMTFEDLEAGKRIRPLSRRGRRRHPLPHLSRHASDARRLFHPRHDQGPLRPLYRGGRAVRRQHAAAVAQIRDRETLGAAPDQARRARSRPDSARSISARSSLAMEEALEALEARGIHLDTLRIRAFPFHDDVFDFIGNHERVFVVEQNRDKQMRTLLTSELRDRSGPARADPAL